MRISPKLTIVAALLAALTTSDAAATTQRALDGWGPFKFAMTPDQARALPGVSWRVPATPKPGAQPAIDPSKTPFMMARPMASEYGPATQIMLNFNNDQKLTIITLSFHDMESAADCEKGFLTLLTRLDAKYGPFTPGGDKDAWVIQDMLIRGGLLQRTSAASAGRSRYWRRIVLPNVSGLNLEAEAKRTFGSRSIELMMYQKDGADSCNRTVLFNASIPTKAELERQAKLKHVPTGMAWRWAEVDRPTGGFSSGRPVFSTGAADNVRLDGGRFAADVTRTADHAGTVHLVGTISSDSKISAHVAGTAPDDFPASLEGTLNMFPTDGEPVDTYEISLTGKSKSGSTSLGMAAYHRNAPHTPTPQACKNIGESVDATLRTPREMTYKGLLQALGCP